MELDSLHAALERRNSIQVVTRVATLVGTPVAAGTVLLAAGLSAERGRRAVLSRIG